MPTSLLLALAFSKTIQLGPEPFGDGTTRQEIRPWTCVSSMTCVQTSAALMHQSSTIRTSSTMRFEHTSTRVERVTQSAPFPVRHKGIAVDIMRFRHFGRGASCLNPHGTTFASTEDEQSRFLQLDPQPSESKRRTCSDNRCPGTCHLDWNDRPI